MPAAAGAEGVLPRADSVSAAARRHDLQVQGDDRVPRHATPRRSAPNLIVHTNTEAIAAGTQPFAVGTQRCCGLLKTRALLDALEAGNYDAAFGGARRDEERSRAKERIFSLRDEKGQWDPKRQRPELWHLLNARIGQGESIRVFPLSNWTEIDVWQYIHEEKIPVVPMYFAKEREVRRARLVADSRRAAVHAARCLARSRRW